MAVIRKWRAALAGTLGMRGSRHIAHRSGAERAVTSPPDDRLLVPAGVARSGLHVDILQVRQVFGVRCCASRECAGYAGGLG